MKKELATVVIPIYLREPSELEKISLTQTLAVLHQYPITFMTPAGFDTSWYEDYCRGKADIRIEAFPWEGYEGFCKLMVDPEFYRRFLQYDYMLICHLDAFVFRDELAQWCQLGYDYMGAVIHNPVFWKEETLWRRLTGFTNPEYLGNGGFALKKVSSFYDMMTRFKLYIDCYRWAMRIQNKGFFDDLFIAQHFPKLSANFRIAPRALAERFGATYEGGPAADLPFTNQDIDSLPFGVHGWIQYNLDYWEPCIRHYGYDVSLPAEMAVAGNRPGHG